MKQTAIRLDIDGSRYLKLEFYGSRKELRLFDEVTISYCENDKCYVLYTNDFVADSLRKFKSMFQKALGGNFEFHPSIQHDIGYLWQEYLAEKKGHNFVGESFENSSFWVGLKHLLFSATFWNTWIYNKDGNIYLEITPSYRWHFSEPEKDEDYVSYDEFIKKFKPLTIFEIDKERAREWLEVVSDLVAIAQKNHEHWSKPAGEG